MRRLVACGLGMWSLAGSGAPALALNWEGHDEWFHDMALIEAFTQDLPPPIAKPMPSCASREALARGNPYEQIPVPGLNCRKGRDGRR
jgi:hypothetical protein